jgi:phage terminase large subunit-like protein
MSAVAIASPPLVISDLIHQCGVDSALFCRTFFRDVYGQAPAPFHAEMWDLIEDPRIEALAFAAFRGSAKTTILRTAMAKRLCYGIGNFLLFVSQSSPHSISSLQWIKRYIENEDGRGDALVKIFGLERGKKWADDHIEIHNRAFGTMFSLKAVGIENQIRGLNLDGKRPDCIFADDPEDEENSGTTEQRRKLSDLFYGALLKSLAPRTECPEAKILLAQTPLAYGDLISQAEVDPFWTFRRYGCYVEDGDREVPSWPARFTLEKLKRDEESHRKRNQMSVFAREMRCLLVSDEETAFLPSWLHIYDTLPEWAAASDKIGAIDPVPPPSEAQQNRGLTGKDFEVHCVVGFSGRKTILLDIRASRGHGPDWSTSTFFELQSRWHCSSWRVEGVNYQRVLKWMLEQSMKEKKQFVHIDSDPDNRKKSVRIRQALAHVCTEGELWIRRDQVQFIDQFHSYPAVAHDDALDCVAMALQRGMNLGLFGALAEQDAADSASWNPERWLVAP